MRSPFRRNTIQTDDVRLVPSHQCELNLRSDHVTHRINDGLFIQFRRRLWNFVTIDASNPKSKQMLKSAALISVEKTRHFDHYPNMIHPFSRFCFVWQTTMMFVWFILLFGLPISLVASVSVLKIMIVKTILDLVCHIDIVLWFFIGYYHKKTQTVVLKRREIVKHYLLTFFLIDLVSSHPIQLYYLSAERKNLYKMAILLVFKLIRVPSLIRYFTRFTEKTNICTANNKSVSFGLWICILLGWVISVIHMLMEEQEIVSLLGLDNTTFPALMTALRLMRQLMGVGVTHPVNTSNIIMIFQIIFITVGALLYILLIAIVMQFYEKRSSSKHKYNHLREEIGEYMNYKELPSRLKHKIFRYMDFKFQKHIFKEEDVLTNLSSVLKHDILMQRCQNMVEKVDFFKGLPQSVILRIVTKLRSEIFLPNDVILLSGFKGHSMYFIYMGTVAVYAPNGKEICHLEDGSHFGEITLVTNEPRVATVVALKECELFRLSRRDFQEAIEPFPEVSKKIRKLAMSRLEEILQTMAEPGSSHEMGSNEHTF